MLQVLYGCFTFLTGVVFKQALCIAIINIEDLLLHKLFHSLLMKPLQSVLQSLVGVGVLVLKVHFLVVLLFDFVDQFADKESYKSIECVFLVRHVIVPEYLFKLIDNLIIRSEVL